MSDFDVGMIAGAVTVMVGLLLGATMTDWLDAHNVKERLRNRFTRQ